ncbi:MAG TPA: hypothetical protein VFE14_20855 [Micromonosporaceae bacterium]|jgi:hypothetical protein|nr:hypothetical protein [Micromonosporaceae bacterium]
MPTAQLTPAARADRATIEGRITELAAVHPLPGPIGVHVETGLTADVFVILVSTVDDVHAWARFLSFPVSVRVYSIGHEIYRRAQAAGPLLGWRVLIGPLNPDRVDPRTPVRLSYRAHRGVLL